MSLFEEKKEQEIEEYEIDQSDDQYMESIVTGNDGRKKVTMFYPKENDIFPVIGQLEMEYDYQDEHKYRSYLKGTGTVIFASDKIKCQNSKTIKTCIILTAAHNVYHHIIHCVQCDTYRNKYRYVKNYKKKIIKQKTICVKCKTKQGTTQKVKMIEPTKTTFRRISVQHKNYGEPLKDYDCSVLYVPNKFMKYSKPKDGFDWAFLSFLDDGVYEKLLHGINIDLVQGSFEFMCQSVPKNVGIFGFPRDKNDIMVGMMSNKLNRFKVRENYITNKNYLYQVGIDTMAGQSGSLIWYNEQDTGDIKVCGIHVGGSAGATEYDDPYNIGTLVGYEVVDKLQCIKENRKMVEEGVTVDVVTVGTDKVKFKIDYSHVSNSKPVKFAAEIKMKNKYEFVDKYIEFDHEEKTIVQLEDNCEYMLRSRVMLEEKDDIWSEYSRIVTFKTPEKLKLCRGSCSNYGKKDRYGFCKACYDGKVKVFLHGGKDRKSIIISYLDQQQKILCKSPWIYEYDDDINGVLKKFGFDLTKYRWVSYECKLCSCGEIKQISDSPNAFLLDNSIMLALYNMNDNSDTKPIKIYKYPEDDFVSILRALDVFPSRITLKFNHKEYDIFKTVGEVGIKHDTSIFTQSVKFLKGNHSTVVCKTVTGRKFDLKVNIDEYTGSDLKFLIQKNSSDSSYNMENIGRLIVAGTAIENETLLKDVQLCSGSTVYMITMLRGSSCVCSFCRH